MLTLLLGTLSCHGPLVIPYQPPVGGTVGDEQLDPSEIEASASSQLPASGGINAAGLAVAGNPYSSFWDLGVGLGVHERVDLRLDAGPRLQAWGYGGQAGFLAHRDERLEIGVTAGFWVTPVSGSFTGASCDSGDTGCEPSEIGEGPHPYEYVAWTPSLGARGSYRLGEWSQLTWRARLSYAFTTPVSGFLPDRMPRSWAVEAAPAWVVGPEGGWWRLGLGASLMWVQGDGARPWWTVNAGLALRVPGDAGQR